MSKKVSFGARPQTTHDPDEWVNGTSAGGTAIVAASPTPPALLSATAPLSVPPERGSMKRLTFDVSSDLHTRIKVQCAQKGVKLADEIRLLLEEHFPPTSERES